MNIPATMSPLPGRLMMFCFIFLFVTHVQGLQFFMDRTPDNSYCGELNCWADRIFTDTSILSIYGLAVYDITQSNTPVKLSSISLFDRIIYADPTTTSHINITSNISSYHAEIVLRFRDNGYCLNGSFLCQLDYVNAIGQPHTNRETVSPGNNEKCPVAFKQFANQAIQIKTHSDQLETEIGELRKQNATMTTEIVELRQNNTATKTENIELRQQNAAMKTEIVELRQQNTAMKTENVELRQNTTAMKIENVELRQNNTAIKTENIELKQQNATMKTEIVELRQNNTAMKTENIELIQQNTVMKTENVELMQNNTAIKTENVELKQQNVTMNIEIVELRQQNTAMKTENVELMQNNTAMKIENVDLRQNNTAMNTENIELKQQNATMKTEIAELRQQNTAMKTELTSALDQLSKLQKIVNSSLDITKGSCFKGVSHNNSREKFLLWGKTPALCDTETDGGGWIIIQRRTKGDVNFYRDWNNYKKGFGTPDTDFWIGNEVIHNLTSHGYTEMRVDMEYQGKQYFAQYTHFYVAAETFNYRLSVIGYNGTPGSDSMAYHDGMNFTTYDRDRDLYSDNCASFSHGAWWYNRCFNSNLNGLWGAQNMSGLAWKGLVYPGSVSVSEMKIRHM